MCRLRDYPHRVDWQILALDAAILLAVPIALVAIQLGGSPALHQLLTVDSEQVTLLGWIGHWTVHYSTDLLLANLVGYLLVTGVAYGLAWTQGERWWFRLSVGAILFVVPSAATLGSELAFAHLRPGLTYTARGASAVVAGLLGLLAVLFLGLLERRYDTRAAVVGGGLVTVSVLLSLLVRVGSPSRATIGGVLGALALVLGFDIAMRLRQAIHEAHSRINWPKLGGTLLAGAVVFVVTLSIAVALFPADPFQGGRIINVFGHAAGFLVGALIALWGRRYWSQRSWV
jgi:hypothetical protein